MYYIYTKNYYIISVDVSLLKYAQFFSPCLIDIFKNSMNLAWFSIHFIYISTRKRLYDCWYQMLMVRRDIRKLYHENGITWTCRKIQFKSSILCTISDRVPTDTVSFNTIEFNTLIVLKYLFVWISSYLERKGYYWLVTYYGFKLRIKYLDIMMSVVTESIIDFSRTFLNIIFKKEYILFLKKHRLVEFEKDN